MASKALLFAEIDRLRAEMTAIIADKSVPLDIRKRVLSGMLGPISSKPRENLIRVFDKVRVLPDYPAQCREADKDDGATLDLTRLEVSDG